MRLSEKRVLFSKYLGYLLNFAYNWGINVAVDDVKANRGHMNNSLHYDGLAVDLVLYDKDWNYLRDTEEYRMLGEQWEKYHPNCYWGGRTRRDEEGTALTKDGNHFSMSWDKRR